MRKLKFRAWSIKKRKFLNIDTLYCASGKVCAVVEDGVVYDIEDVILEQYTGLKDKNGKEIYEGDIVEARWYRAKHARFGTKGEVKFNNGWFYIKDSPDGEDRLGVPIHNCYDLEIIGNIHENPELLKNEEE